MIFPGFSSGPSVPPPPPPPPTREDPAIAEAKEAQRQAELKRKGRKASVITGGQGVEDNLGTAGGPQVERPRAAQLLGQ